MFYQLIRCSSSSVVARRRPSSSVVVVRRRRSSSVVRRRPTSSSSFVVDVRPCNTNKTSSVYSWRFYARLVILPAEAAKRFEAAERSYTKKASSYLHQSCQYQHLSPNWQLPAFHLLAFQFPASHCPVYTSPSGASALPFAILPKGSREI